MIDFLAEKAYIEKKLESWARGAIRDGKLGDGQQNAFRITEITHDHVHVHADPMADRGVAGPHLVFARPRDPRYHVYVECNGDNSLASCFPMVLTDPRCAAPSKTGWKRELGLAVGWWLGNVL